MRSIIIPICITMCVIISACSKIEDNIQAQAPLPNDVISVEYFSGNGDVQTIMSFYTDSLRFIHTYYGRTSWVTLDTLIPNNNHYLPSLVKLLPLNDFWKMNDIKGDPRIQDASTVVMTIKGYSPSDNNSIASRTILTKTLRFSDDVVPDLLRKSTDKIDSLVHSFVKLTQ
jgi:hypothetical protein